MKTTSIWVGGIECEQTLMNEQEFLSFVKTKVNDNYYQTVLNMTTEELEFFAMSFSVLLTN